MIENFRNTLSKNVSQLLLKIISSCLLFFAVIFFKGIYFYTSTKVWEESSTSKKSFHLNRLLPILFMDLPAFRKWGQSRRTFWKLLDVGRGVLLVPFSQVNEVNALGCGYRSRHGYLKVVDLRRWFSIPLQTFPVKANYDISTHQITFLCISCYF